MAEDQEDRMTRARTNVTRPALALALLLGLGGCSVPGTGGNGLTFATPLAESPTPAWTVSEELHLEEK
jgi:hypothetical protein